MADQQDDPPGNRRFRPCPGGSPQRLCKILGFRERSIGELELRVVLGDGDLGVCDLIVDERDDEVWVCAAVCCDDLDLALCPKRDALDVPVRTWLQRPLENRPVIDADTDLELPLYTPTYLNNVRQADHGYRPARRRARSDSAS